MFGKIKVIAFASVLVLVGLILSCSEDTNYDQRTVVYVSNVNEGEPFMCDVLNQGDSLWNETRTAYKIDDDFVVEDYILVEFHNKPYSSIIDPESGSLGDFLVTGYDVEFLPFGGDPVPVPPFSGAMSLLVPAGELVQGAILLVPYGAKNVDPLNALKYDPMAREIMTTAHLTFHGHEIQSSSEVNFEAWITVNFADPLLTTDQQNKQN